VGMPFKFRGAINTALSTPVHLSLHTNKCCAVGG
jgi:hypothetical protein